MARITIDIAASQLARANKLVNAGAYESIQQLGEIAFANQLALEDGADPEDLVEIARQRRTQPGRPTKKKSRKVPPLPPRKHRSDVAEKVERNVEPMPREAMTFEKAVLPLALRTAADQTPEAASTSPVAPDVRILALVNKPFGLKLVARMVMVQDVEKWPRIDSLVAHIGLVAAAIGAAAADEDRAAERSRHLLQTGLPTIDNGESQDRFAAQYVARVARSGQVSPGAITQFGLAAVSDGRIALTSAGLELARLRNPVLDGGVRPWERLLSGKEQKYLVEHIKRFVPAEARDSRAVVAAVQAGHDRPESLLEVVKPSLPQSWSDVQARGYLAGLVTRLAELDVIARAWSGRTVHYELGTLAPTMLSQ